MNFSLEKKFGNIVVGIDEVGRGPLAGPVVAVAVHIKTSSWKDFLIFCLFTFYYLCIFASCIAYDENLLFF